MRAVVIGIEKGKAAIFEKNGGMRYIPDAGYVRGQLIEVPDVDKNLGTIPFVRTGSGTAGKRAFRYGIGIAAAVSIVLAGGGITAYASTASTVTVGTYPVIEYRVNYFDRVIGVDINGDDIEIPREDIRSINKKIRGKKLDKAMEISFDEINTDVIISEDMRDDPIRVDSGNPRRKEKLEGRARVEFDEAIERKIIIEMPGDEMPADKQGDIDNWPTDSDDSNDNANIKSKINNYTNNDDSINGSDGAGNTGEKGNSGNSENIKEDNNPSGQSGDQQPGQGNNKSDGGQSGQGGNKPSDGQQGQNQGQNGKPSGQPSNGQSGQNGNQAPDGQQGQNQGQNGKPSDQPSNGQSGQNGNQPPDGQPGQAGNQPPDGQPGSDPGQVNPPPEQPSDGQPMNQPAEGQPGQDQGQNGQPMDQPPDGQPGQSGSNPPGDQPGANQGHMNPPPGEPQGQPGDQPY